MEKKAVKEPPTGYPKYPKFCPETRLCWKKKKRGRPKK